MGWETRLTTTIHFNRESYNSLSGVKECLEEVDFLIESYEDKLKALAFMTDPKKLCNSEDDPIYWIRCEVNEALEELRELYINKFKLQCLIDDWDKCHTKDGDPIHLPEGVGDEYGDCAFIDGEFILTKKEKEEDHGW